MKMAKCLHEVRPLDPESGRCLLCIVAELKIAFKQQKHAAEDYMHAARGVPRLKAQIKAFRAEIQDCRDAWEPDQPPSDLRQFLIDLESVLE